MVTKSRFHMLFLRLYTTNQSALTWVLTRMEMMMLLMTRLRMYVPTFTQLPESVKRNTDSWMVCMTTAVMTTKLATKTLFVNSSPVSRVELTAKTEKLLLEDQRCTPMVELPQLEDRSLPLLSSSLELLVLQYMLPCFTLNSPRVERQTFLHKAEPWHKYSFVS